MFRPPIAIPRAPTGFAALALAAAALAAAGCGGSAEPAAPRNETLAKKVAEAKTPKERQGAIRDAMLFPEGKPAAIGKGRAGPARKK